MKKLSILFFLSFSISTIRINTMYNYITHCRIELTIEMNNVESYLENKPIHYAVISKNTKTIEALLNKDSKQSNMENFYGITPLHIATLCENLEITVLLLKHGANPIHKSNVKILLSLFGNNHAIEKMNSRIAFIHNKYGMLAKKSRNALRNFLLINYTQTPLDVALDSGNEEIIAKLCKAVRLKKSHNL